MPRPSASLRRDLWWGWSCLVVGVFLGLAWRLLAPTVTQRSSPAEVPAGLDSVLALLGLAVGIAVGVLLALRPGEVPARRLVVVLVSLCGAGTLAWLTGYATGVSLGAVGAAFLAPPAAAATVLIVTGVRYVARWGSADRAVASAPGHGRRAGAGEPDEVAW